MFYSKAVYLGMNDQSIKNKKLGSMYNIRYATINDSKVLGEIHSKSRKLKLVRY